MFALLLRADDPTHLRQRALGRRVVKGVEARVGVAPGAERRAVFRRLVLLKVGQHVVLKVVHVLPHLPGDAGLF